MTFSLIGRCARTRAIGIAATTGGIAVGGRVAFVEFGVGAILTQHRTDPRLGPRGLGLLASGCTPAATVAALAASAEAPRWRQLAAMDPAGRTACFHGDAVKPVRGAAEGEDVIAIGNILANDRVLPAMVAAFAAAPGAHLADRLIAALAAGEAAGGEGGPLVSAALKVAAEPGFSRIDLRIDRATDPIAALAALWAAYAPHEAEYARRAVEPEAASGAAAETAMKAGLAG